MAGDARPRAARRSRAAGISRAFLSHASADKVLAKQIFRTLRDQGVDVWFDSLELRPGDSLLAAIKAGIQSSDALLVLVTAHSVRSSWVSRELALALERDEAGRGPTVIPLVVEDCEVPVGLRDRLNIRIDQDGRGLLDIIPAIFRSSHVVDVPLRKQDLSCDRVALLLELQDFARSRKRDLRIRIDHGDFNRRFTELVRLCLEQASEAGLAVPDAHTEFDLLPITLPLYWTNLAALLRQLVRRAFALNTRNLAGVQAAADAVERSLTFAQLCLFSRLGYLLSNRDATQHGQADIAGMWLRLEALPPLGDREALVRTICAVPSHRKLLEVRLQGDLKRHVISRRLFVPVLNQDDERVLIRGERPAAYCLPDTWISICLPQVIGRHLCEATFGEGRPVHELTYATGFEPKDYTSISLA